MKYLIVIIIGLFLSVNLFAQVSDFVTVSKINEITADIDNNSDYLRLHEDGELSKKKLIFFEKTVGGFFSNIVYKDTLILSIENEFCYDRKSRTKNEKFYFTDNKLIKFSEEVHEKGMLRHRIDVFYKDQKIIKVDKEIHDSFKLDIEKKKSIIEKSKREISLRQMTTSEWKQIFGEK